MEEQNIASELANAVNVDVGIVRATGWNDEKLTELYNKCGLAKKGKSLCRKYMLAGSGSVFASFALTFVVSSPVFALPMFFAGVVTILGSALVIAAHEETPGRIAQEIKDAALDQFADRPEMSPS